MSAKSVVQAMIEDESADPKEIAMDIPSTWDEAIAKAEAIFDKWIVDGRVYHSRSADEAACEIAQAVCAEFGLEKNSDFDRVVTPLFLWASQEFPEEKDHPAQGDICGPDDP